MAVSTIAKTDMFRGADGSKQQSLGTSASVTPPKDGWLRVSFRTSSGQTIAPVATVSQNGLLVAYGQGLTTADTTASVGFPVKAGLTYIITAYRSTLTDEILFY